MAVFLGSLVTLPLAGQAGPPLQQSTDRVPVWGIDQLRVTVHTGDDNLRSGAGFRLVLEMKNGTRLVSPYLNCGEYAPRSKHCEQLRDRTTASFDWNVNGRALLEDVWRIVVEFRGPGQPPFESGDNWNLNRLEIAAVYRPARGGRDVHVVYDSTARPLYRFKEVDSWTIARLRPFTAPDSVRAAPKTVTGKVSVPVQTKTRTPKPKPPPGPTP
ncbi:MAG: hypothetical protein R2910_12955 [Gemmatimonadales bacterium]